MALIQVRRMRTRSSMKPLMLKAGPMTRWQRVDLLARCQLEKRARAGALRGKGWREVLQAVVAKALGF